MTGGSCLRHHRTGSCTHPIDLGLKLAYTLDTHIHADHLTGVRKVKSLVGSKIAAPGMDGLSCVIVGVEEEHPFQVGDLAFQPMFTPGLKDTGRQFNA